MKEYLLKNGTRVLIRGPRIEDAEALIYLLKNVDKETRFLAREPGEFQMTAEEERTLIERMTEDEYSTWFLAECEGKVVGQCYVGLVRRNLRYRHRAGIAVALLKDYWHMGIGGKLMQACVEWCEENGIEQIELDVVAENEHALNMYRSFGFEIIGKLPHALKYEDRTYADEYLMVKRIRYSAGGTLIHRNMK